ncbi:MAG: 4Fe-4S binding protein, partial [Planctomycetes bacterium]|nr:4Fe-4S binding protein [Planctomycetota bacterium]
EQAAERVLTSHPLTRDDIWLQGAEGLSCPVEPRDYVSLHLDPSACVGCGVCQMVCETEGFGALQAIPATVLKPHNYECTRDHACARNCPTSAIRLGNL